MGLYHILNKFSGSEREKIVAVIEKCGGKNAIKIVQNHKCDKDCKVGESDDDDSGEEEDDDSEEEENEETDDEDD